MIGDALSSLRRGFPILLFDSSGREDEVDYVMPANAIKPETIRTMRKECGGLICLAISGEFAKTLDLPYMVELMSKDDRVRGLIPERTAYGDKPAFSLSINHRSTYTGVTDNDRAFTIAEFAKLKTNEELVKSFYAPGHVHLLIAKRLSDRRGHTELSIELSNRACIAPAMVLCEMMGDDGTALSVSDAKTYAEKNRIQFVDGGQL
ncbi:MAG: 3,4-dihydroxy-2-butanone-4-phosphate synthase [Candidatus Altiarchaeota archaeon]|nr:3,4-dihydroxy-2-butanone-4-phosphate synthase [Candidatus Altiarchaeota archaeon]